MSSSSKFTNDGVRDYEKRRYRGLDQRLVHARETRLIGRFLRAASARRGAGGGPGRALDLPCGYGRFTDLVRGEGFDVVSADLSLEMVRRARQNTRPAGGPGVVSDARKLPFKDAVFDAVTSIRFFHHLHAPADRAVVLGEFRRTTRGHVVLSFYRANGLHALERRLRRRFGKSRTNIKMIEPGVFEREAEAAGFEVVRVVPLFRGVHAYHLALLRKV
jgi:SAM-dependent methyltransferase